MLSAGDRKTLLRMARESIRASLEGRPPPAVSVESEDLKALGGAFVTLKNRGRLRGCIGTFTSDRPLVETVQRMAVSATRDPRFLADPITSAELDAIDIEISVLSPLEKTSDPAAEIELGRHGICIESPYGSGCFLPQVAAETGWSKEEFLSQCAAMKAGLGPDGWKRPDTTVYTSPPRSSAKAKVKPKADPPRAPRRRVDPPHRAGALSLTGRAVPVLRRRDIATRRRPPARPRRRVRKPTRGLRQP
jgi:AmmeMemoRadiSam system protein A